jgi:hypothetical protein
MDFQMKNILVFCVFLYSSFSLLYSQPCKSPGEYERIIQNLFLLAANTQSDSEKVKIYREIGKMFSDALVLPDAFVYPFDSLKKVGKISSNNQKLRVFTWNLAYDDGTHRYFGLFLYRRKSNEKPTVFRLTDQTDNIQEPASRILDLNTWFGALYYKIVERKWEGLTLYTLLGFDPNDIFTSRKIIDCFYLKDDTIPVFGAPLFKMNDKIQNRVIFEYSAKVSMSLLYNENLKMIVYDHLSPAKPSYAGNYQFYGPDFSYDGFKFIDNHWVLFEDIDVRNR